MNVAVLLQVFTFFVEHREEIKTLIKNIQALIPDAPGQEKAAIVKAFIAKALGLEEALEPVWPIVSLAFNALVASVKSTLPTVAK